MNSSLEQDPKGGINNSSLMWAYDPQRGFRLKNPSEKLNVVGLYECQAEYGIEGRDTLKYGVNFEIRLSVSKRIWLYFTFFVLTCLSIYISYCFRAAGQNSNEDQSSASNDKNDLNSFVQIVVSSVIIFLGIMVIILGLVIAKILTRKVSNIFPN